MLEIGTIAPEFDMPGTDPYDGDPATYTLSGILERGPALLDFYFFDRHPACTANMCSLHDLSWFDLNANLSGIGVSTDGVFSHELFAEDGSLQPEWEAVKAAVESLPVYRTP